ncbi:hypothetical protein [Agreia sp. COWG]|uniref:hypothetical protein n=1 Tax=Agreia sp. COWG TaxID=2773266 RepID=UPI001928FF1A|nr:hypothetical protein [Agreia sp. COWG]CAD5990760.1 conserved protein of unknown function [Agreia sp. COWG]
MAMSGGDTDRRQSGDGDAPLQDAHREALKRTAFGRAQSPADEARAAEAQHRLLELDAIEAEARDAEARAQRDAHGARERRRRRIRSRVIAVTGIAATLGALVAVYAGLVTPTSSTESSSRQGDLRSIAPTSTDSVDLGRGTVAPAPAGPVGRVTSGSAASAEHWFDDPQKETDVVVQLANDLDPSSTRAVDSSVDGWQVFVAKDKRDNFCLVAVETGNSVTGWDCASPDQFTSAGLLLTASGATAITVYWDGFDLTTEPGANTVG